MKTKNQSGLLGGMRARQIAYYEEILGRSVPPASAAVSTSRSAGYSPPAPPSAEEIARRGEAKDWAPPPAIELSPSGPPGGLMIDSNLRLSLLEAPVAAPGKEYWWSRARTRLPGFESAPQFATDAYDLAEYLRERCPDFPYYDVWVVQLAPGVWTAAFITDRPGHSKFAEVAETFLVPRHRQLRHEAGINLMMNAAAYPPSAVPYLHSIGGQSMAVSYVPSAG